MVCSAEGSKLLQHLREAQTPDGLNTAHTDTRAFLEPLLHDSAGAYGHGDQDLAALSRKYAPFLVDYLKVSFARLSDPGLAAALVQHVVLGISGLEALRSSLKGRPDELEIQRHSLVCKLVSLQLYSAAAEEGWQLYRIICSSWGKSNLQQQQGQQLPPLPELPLPGQEEPRERIAVVVGLAANLLHSVVCSKASPLQLTALPVIARGLGPWMRLLLPQEQRKHQDALFRSMYKVIVCLRRSIPFARSGGCSMQMQAFWRHCTGAEFPACMHNPLACAHRVRCCCWSTARRAATARAQRHWSSAQLLLRRALPRPPCPRPPRCYFSNGFALVSIPGSYAVLSHP